MQYHYLSKEFVEANQAASAPVFYNIGLSSKFKNFLRSCEKIGVEVTNKNTSLSDAFISVGDSEKQNFLPGSVTWEQESGRLDASAHIEDIRRELNTIEFYPSRRLGTQEGLQESMSNTLKALQSVIELRPNKMSDIDQEQFVKNLAAEMQRIFFVGIGDKAPQDFQYDYRGYIDLPIDFESLAKDMIEQSSPTLKQWGIDIS